MINLDISDIAHPKLIGELNISPPFGGRPQSLHSVLPLWDRNLLFVSSEASDERCAEALNFAALIDNKNPAQPRLISMFPLPAPPPGAPYKNFCEKGGRFGPHNTNQEIHLPDVEKPGNLIYLTYFNAGLRVFDIKDPVHAGRDRLVHSAATRQNAGPLPKDWSPRPRTCSSTPAAMCILPTRTGACGSRATPARTSRRRPIADDAVLRRLACFTVPVARCMHTDITIQGLCKALQ